MAQYKNDNNLGELNTNNLTLKTNYNTNFKINDLLRGKNIVLLFELSNELQSFIEQESKKGNITRYKTPAGIGIDKNELENLINPKVDDNTQLTEETQKIDDDPSNSFYFKSLAELRMNRVNTTNYIKHKGQDKIKYVDMRLVLKQPIKLIAKALGCNQEEILKQLEPILELQFNKRKQLKGDMKK